MSIIDLSGVDVSRETSERLDHYLALLKKWNPRINLVATTTLDAAVQRHFVDSAQIFLVDGTQSGSWVDLGSGGGFPGLVIAMILHEKQPARRVTLIESDRRKATFLRTVIRDTGLSTSVLTDRIETAPVQKAMTLTARALAPLPKLLEFTARHLATHGTALFMKGKNWEKEVEEASTQWHFSYTAHTSKTNPHAVVLEIGELDHV